MWVLLVMVLASAGAPGGGVHSYAATTVNQMTIHSAASSLAATSSCFQQK